MDVLSISNPNVIAPILIEAFKEMPLEEFQKTLADILNRGEQFARRDDSAFSGQLSTADATLYALCCRPFHNALHELKSLPRDKIALHTLARTIAWWQTINAFRTLHGGDPLENT